MCVHVCGVETWRRYVCAHLYASLRIFMHLYASLCILHTHALYASLCIFIGMYKGGVAR